MKKIRLNKDKNITIYDKIIYYLNPDYIYIPMLDDCSLKKGDLIYKNAIVTNNLYSSISGTFEDLVKIGDKSYIKIANDFRELEKNKKHSKLEITLENIRSVLKKYNKFELYNKFLDVGEIENITLSVISDNPYVYNKIFLLKEKIAEILEIFNAISMIYKSKNNYLVMKSNESFMIDECLNIIGTYPNIKITLVNDEYLLEKEEYLEELLGVKDKTLYLDIHELMELSGLLNGNDLTTKLITISGDAIVSSMVLRVKKYVSLRDIIKKCIVINKHSYEIIINGLMTGYKIDNNNDVIITSNIESINIMTKKRLREQPCINCGKCIAICPKKVNPLTLKNKEKCIDCGLCSFICPVHINLKELLKGDQDV